MFSDSRIHFGFADYKQCQISDQNRRLKETTTRQASQPVRIDALRVNRGTKIVQRNLDAQLHEPLARSAGRSTVHAGILVADQLG